jgi:aminopeptidase N
MRASLEKFRYQSIHSRPFIDFISQKNPQILRFFENWIYSRRLPEISCKTKISENTAEVTVTQKETDFVFPLWIEISTASGDKAHLVIVDQRNQSFRFSGDERIRQVVANPRCSPVILRKGE